MCDDSATMDLFLRLGGPWADGPVTLVEPYSGNGDEDHSSLEEEASFENSMMDEDDPELSGMVDDDCRSDDSRSSGEIEVARHEMEEMMDTIPGLRDRYPLLDKLGEVYKALDRHHECYNNAQWQCYIDKPQRPSSSPNASDSPPQVFLAVKRIYVTASPQRILNELEILETLRPARHTSFLVAAIRHEDQVLAVMPYQKHQDFRLYYRSASLPLIRSYFRCMFAALGDAHARDIIHRDVKPANFLFNCLTGQGTLCDFGLAERVEPMEWHATCLHSLPCAASGRPHGVRLDRPYSTYDQLRDREHRYEQRPQDFQQSPAGRPWMLPDEDTDEYADLVEAKHNQPFWEPSSVQNRNNGQRLGFLKDALDRRPTIRTNRAGTRGFRAPEVLLKCPDQTVALDVWSAGIVLLCFLTRRFPFFNSNDDIEALMELAALLGSHRIQKCAGLHSASSPLTDLTTADRTFVTNVPQAEAPTHNNLHEVVRALNPKLWTDELKKAGGQYEGSELHHAVDLMRRCLATDCTRRLTAMQALEHPFLKQQA